MISVSTRKTFLNLKKDNRMITKRVNYLIFSLLTLLTFTIACDNNSENDASTGRLSIRLTDAPFPTDLVAEANITINKIEIRESGETEGNPFMVLTEEEMSFNLLDLTNEVTASLVDMDVPVGTYDLIRLYVSDANVVLSDESVFDLKVPSGSSSGLKVFLDPAIEVAGGLSAELLLDFDVSRSFVLKGNHATPAGIKGFNFKPVIKASNLSTAGRLIGTVTDSQEAVVEGAQVSVFAADTLNTSTFTDANGGYAVLGMDPGMYDVTYEYEDYQPVTIEDIEIAIANVTVQDVQLTE
jgi:hypothetical protein